MINDSVPSTIPEAKIIKSFRDDKSKIYHCITNHNVCLDAARKIGAVVVNMGAEDLLEGKPYLVFGLIWQIIKIGLLKEVTVEAHPELKQLMEADEANLPAEALLLKWFNYHLEKAGVNYRIKNLSSDITNSDAYIHLMHRLSPETCSLDLLNEKDPLKRAEAVLLTAEKMGVRTHLRPEDVVAGNERLNLVFTASMFNHNSGMARVAEEMEQESAKLQRENATLKQAKIDLERQFQQLQIKISDQTSQLSALKQEKATVEHKVVELAQQNDSLSTKVSRVEQINTMLSDKIEMLSGEKNSVVKAREDLAAQYESVTARLQQTSQELERERISLETSEFCGASLANDLEELRSRHEKLEYLIEHLKIERMRSDMHIERLRVLYNWFPTTEALCEAIYGSLSLANLQKSAAKVGYLTKKARNGNNWKYRYFVLRDNFLFYFKSDKDQNSQASGVIRIDDAVLRFAENPTRRDLKDQWLLCIEVPNNNDAIKHHSFYIAGEDHELEGWKTAIKAAAGWWTKKSSLSSIKKTRNASNASSTKAFASSLPPLPPSLV